MGQDKVEMLYVPSVLFLYHVHFPLLQVIGIILNVFECNMDVIFCHNMLIYFRRWRRKEILHNLAERLKPGGVLVIATGEVVDWEHPSLTRLPKDNVQAYIKH